MDWGAIQENYFFMFLFLTALTTGAFIIGIFFGYAWLQLHNLRKNTFKPNYSPCPERQKKVLAHTRRPHISKVKDRGSGVRQSLPTHNVSFHAA